jgi:hypothetical protein
MGDKGDKSNLKLLLLRERMYFSDVQRPTLPNPLDSQITDNQVLEFIQAAQQGDLEKVKSFLTKNKSKVRGHSAAYTM